MDTVIFKMDRKLKQAAQKKAKIKGFTLTDLYKSTTWSFVKDEIDFGLVVRPQLKDKVVRELLKISRDIKEGKNLSPAFKTIKEMKAYLEK
jgi:hypothetical protein